jgi:hypothetical protein
VRYALPHVIGSAELGLDQPKTAIIVIAEAKNALPVAFRCRLFRLSVGLSG